MGLHKKTKPTIDWCTKRRQRDENKLKNTLQDVIQENFPNLANRPTCNFSKFRQHLKDILQEEQP